MITLTKWLRPMPLSFLGPQKLSYKEGVVLKVVLVRQSFTVFLNTAFCLHKQMLLIIKLLESAIIIHTATLTTVLLPKAAYIYGQHKESRPQSSFDFRVLHSPISGCSTQCKRLCCSNLIRVSVKVLYEQNS